MFNTLPDKILNNASSELFFLLVGSLILFIIQLIYKHFKNIKYRHTIKSEIKFYKKRKAAINVIDLANGDPEFEKKNIFTREISTFGVKRCLYIGIPDSIKSIVTSKEINYGYSKSQLTKFNTDTSFDQGHDFKDLVDMTEIQHLPDLIAKHKHIVGTKFLETKDGLIFNGNKYGIFNMNFTRFGENENPGAEIDFFHTDYFTHRVFRSIYHELKSTSHPIASAEISNFLKYKPFLTSFGVNTLLICDGEKGKEIVLCKRSNRVHGNASKFHITMNEGLSQTDKDPFGKIDIERCFKRGLAEELGINDKLYQYGITATFYDFFLEKNNFEIGLSSVFELDLNFKKDIEPLIARDKCLEADSFVTIPLNSKEINKFIAKHEFIPHGLYVLERVLLRKNILLSTPQK
ncbi:hypothetical protein [Maridesulfovibrio ferrireducens]|uniref:hypothetical protein n=1 Tax=Maridesulfovibrio ferrireducens TaxID=246191 RepID=UPI001A1ED0E2|nr:hypothetical protein [Maridesulfovibrio ferrireducens]MBI9109923.1 hypothetical protein [Maridesulfovibrio ferrireducens]